MMRVSASVRITTIFPWGKIFANELAYLICAYLAYLWITFLLLLFTKPRRKTP
jgi:hypothetical protein